MTVEGLNYVNNLMESLNISYEFMEWTSDIPETYWIGEYQEIEPLNEDGMEECVEGEGRIGGSEMEIMN